MSSAPSTWPLPRAPGPSWPPRREPVPIIVAEALQDVADPLTTALDPGRFVPPDRIVGAIAASLRPSEATDPAPAWLLPEQVTSFRRVLAALDRYQGALLADPVGSGKTWIALAVASARAGRSPAAAVVPAALRSQWRETAARAGVPLMIHSHEHLSRGRLPPVRPRLVIVDESHRFRNPGIRRYRMLARWLPGRLLLLLSGTPVVNALEDLTHQLRLGVRDDALAARGVPDLPGLLAQGIGHPALGDLLITRVAPRARPGVRRTTLPSAADGVDQALLEGLGALTLSTDAGVAALVRVSLWRALASSRAALRAALRRYLLLLDHAAHAASAGRRPARAEIRRLSGDSLSQLVLWPLLPEGATPADLVLSDRPRVVRLIHHPGIELTDPRVALLRNVLEDSLPTLVFTTSRATIHHLRLALDRERPAWLSGDEAGIGACRLPREAVLTHFRPGRASAAGTPTVLLATDVAAEGLDLQRCRRVVHYDLPWTSVRIDQREGRAIRLGADGDSVEVIRFAAWPALEERLRQDHRLAVKRGLARAAGLDEPGRWLFRWREDLAELATGTAAAGLCMVNGKETGWLIGLALDLGLEDGSRLREPASLWWLAPDGTLSEDPELNLVRLGSVRSATGRVAEAEERAELMRLLTAALRDRLRRLRGASWISTISPVQRRAIRRMRALAAEAARTRDERLLALAGAALDWLAGGLTAGETMALEALTDAPLPELCRRWKPLLSRGRSRPVPLVRLTGAIGVTTFPPCQSSAPCCSTSTGP